MVEKFVEKVQNFKLQSSEKGEQFFERLRNNS